MAKQREQMRKLMLATVAVVSLTGAAHAQVQGDTIQQNPARGSIALHQDGQTGPASASVANSKSRSNATAVGGSGGAGGRGGSGGMGGSGQGGSASSNASVAPGAVQIGGAGVGNFNYRESAASAIAPSIGGGGFDCPVVGFGAAGQAIGGGGGFGPSWLSTKCDRRKKAELLWNQGHHDAAVFLMRDGDDEVRKALEEEAQQRPVQPVSTFTLADYCKRGGWTKAQIVKKYPECRGIK